MSDACPYCRRELGLVIRTADAKPLHEITLPGQVPGGSKYNTRLDAKAGRRVPMRKGGKPTAFEEWRSNLWSFQGPGGHLRPPKSAWPWPVILELQVYHQDRRRRDAAGWLEAIGHFLEERRTKIGRRIVPVPGTGWVKDDSQLIPVVHPSLIDRENPRAVIRLWRPA